PAALNFTTAAPADTTPPTLTSSSPADDAMNVAVGANIVLNFSEAVKAGTGTIEIRNVSDNSLVQSISVGDTSQAHFSGSTFTIDPSADLGSGGNYYVLVSPGAVQDVAGNAFAGISSPTALDFSTAASYGSQGGGNFDYSYSAGPLVLMGSSPA